VRSVGKALLKHSLFRIFKKNFMTRKKTTEEFVADAVNKLGCRYDYSLVEYRGANYKVAIRCHEHGLFYQTPTCHLTLTYGCPKCSRKEQSRTKIAKRSETFLDDVVSIHGDTYILDKVVYTGKNNKITVTCREHGDFLIGATSFRVGCGCIKCAKNGYRPNKAGSLYVLVADDYTKIGITNNNLIQRLKSVSKTSGKKFEILKEFSFCDGAVPLRLETKLLEILRSLYKSPTEKFDGCTETFLQCDNNFVILKIEELIVSLTEGQNSP
jgi:hypothetical protein